MWAQRDKRTLLTSAAKSRRSRRIENSAGRVQPLLLVKYRKNKLGEAFIQSNWVQDLDKRLTYETSAFSSLKASMGLFLAI